MKHDSDNNNDDSNLHTCHLSMPYSCMGSSLYTSVCFAINGFSAYSAQPSVNAV